MTKNLGFKKSPNFRVNRGIWSNKADVIVLHVTEGSFQSAVNWLCNSAAEASSHFVTAHDGSYIQLVNLKDTAWANGNGPKTFKQAIKPIIKRRVPSNANYYTFSIENEGFSYKDNYGIPTANQMEAIYEVCHKIVDYILTYNKSWRASRENIIGHCHISSIDKPSCPAPNHAAKFPFDAIINNINNYIATKLGIPKPTTTTTPNKSASTVHPTIKVGTIVKVKSGAKSYTGETISSLIYIKRYSVSSISGDRVVLDKNGICTPFHVSDLIVVK